MRVKKAFGYIREFKMTIPGASMRRRFATNTIKITDTIKDVNDIPGDSVDGRVQVRLRRPLNK
jgi:hypothetical protein